MQSREYEWLESKGRIVQQREEVRELDAAHQNQISKTELIAFVLACFVVVLARNCVLGVEK
jgi:hypothetical protein